jgi:MoxR-like ATPase
MLKVKSGDILQLERTGAWPKTVHVFDNKSIWALKAALAAERPLLVRGEPGIGKSQLARAAAQALGRVFISSVVHARSESRELHYHFDAVARLAKAQLLGALYNSTKSKVDIDKELKPENFLYPGPLWWTFDWNSAEKQRKRFKSTALPPKPPTGWQAKDGAVLLIDEIDKADVDLPNGLLETLGNGSFSVPFIGTTVSFSAKKGNKPPLVVITTNEERELPAAFLRRCLVLKLALPEDNDEELKIFLYDRGKAQANLFKNPCSDKVLNKTASLLMTDRRDAKELGLSPPGLAEYIDMLRAVNNLSGSEAKQLAALDEISEFALKKHPCDML